MLSATTWRFVGSTVLVGFLPGRILDHELNALLDELAQHPEVERLVVVPHGTVPTPGQRERVHRWLVASGARVAVLSSAVLVRGAVTALGWFGLPVRAFPEPQLSDALEFLKTPASEGPAIRAGLEHLQRRLRELASARRV